MEEKEFIKINPVIIYPSCLIAGEKQDCFNCELHKNNLCNSPRSLCLRPYHLHKYGCPNFGNLPICPPNIPMYDKVFDMDKDIYLIYTTHDVKSHYEMRRNKFPDATEYEIKNVIYWQGTAKMNHRKEIKRFFLLHDNLLDYKAITPEALGVDVFATLKKVGINLDWPPTDLSYRVSFAAKPIKDDFSFFNDENLSHKLKKQ